MPRKQRFKPSRKPKQAENPATEQSSNQPGSNTGKRDESTGSERPRIDPGDIETGGGMRTSAIIDDGP